MLPRDSAGPSGFLPGIKPSGITSFDVIKVLRRSLGIRKLGHSGVLDRPASGVLVVGLNRATRLFEFFGGFEKEYEAEVCLGVTTTTDDLTGEVTTSRDASAVTREQFESALMRYRGTFAQVPPAFSLAKKAGKESYRYALAGEQVEIAARQVTVLDSRVEGFGSAALRGDETPDLSGGGSLPPSGIPADGRLAAAATAPNSETTNCAQVWISCTGGLYVRSLARDVGTDLGCGAALGKLVRTRVGPFRLEECLTLEQVAAHMDDGGTVEDIIRPLASIAPEDARITLDSTQLALVRSGQAVRRFRQHMPPAAEQRGDTVFGLGEDGELVAVLAIAGTSPQGLVELKPVKVVG